MFKPIFIILLISFSFLCSVNVTLACFFGHNQVTTVTLSDNEEFIYIGIPYDFRINDKSLIKNISKGKYKEAIQFFLKNDDIFNDRTKYKTLSLLISSFYNGKSGIYQNNMSKIPRVEMGYHEGYVYPFNDGHHYVKQQVVNSPSLVFYKDKTILKEYNKDYFKNIPNFLEPCYSDVWNDSVRIDTYANKQLLKVNSLEFFSYYFNPKDGSLEKVSLNYKFLASKKALSLYFSIGVYLLPWLFFLLLAYNILKIIRHKRTN
jgi:hypothetical protein